MDFLDFLRPDKYPIDFVIVALVIFAGIFQKKYLADVNMSQATKTLITSLLFSVIYAVLIAVAGKYCKDLPVRWFFSYVLATSLYELLLKKFIKKYFPDENL